VGPWPKWRRGLAGGEHSSCDDAGNHNRRAREQRPGRATWHYQLSDLMRSEWTKLRTPRSTLWALGFTFGVGVGVSVLATAESRARWSTFTAATKANFDPSWVSLAGTLFGQLSIGVLGVLVMSGEYASGTIRATLAVAPKRLDVLVAKTLVFGTIALVVAELTSFVSFFVGQALLTAPARHATLSNPGVLRSVVGTGLVLAVMGLLALGLATILRHSAGAISAYVAIFLVIPIVVEALPESMQAEIARFLPLEIGRTMIVGQPDANMFSAWTGFGILCGYAVAALLIGGVLLLARDA
jgi:ABC-2 type transport system permease protein